MNGITFILTVAMAAAFVLLVVGLVVVIIYYRCRLKDSHRTLARFIKENIALRECRESSLSMSSKSNVNEVSILLQEENNKHKTI